MTMRSVTAALVMATGTAGALAQNVGTPIRVSDVHSGDISYFETVVGVNPQNHKEVLVAAIQRDDSGASSFRQIFYGVSLDAGATFTLGALQAPACFNIAVPLINYGADPMIAVSPSGHIWLGALFVADGQPRRTGMYVARKNPGDTAL